MFKLKVEHFILFKLFNQVEGIYFCFLRLVEFLFNYSFKMGQTDFV